MPYIHYKVSIGLILGLGLAMFATAIMSYLAILRIVRRHKRQIHSQMQAFIVPTARQGRSLVTMFYIHTIFILCGIPYLVSLLYVTLTDGKDQIKAFHLSPAMFWSATIILMNSSINPYIYYWRTKDFRDAVNRQLNKISQIFTSQEGSRIAVFQRHSETARRRLKKTNPRL